MSTPDSPQPQPANMPDRAPQVVLSYDFVFNPMTPEEMKRFHDAVMALGTVAGASEIRTAPIAMVSAEGEPTAADAPQETQEPADEAKDASTPEGEGSLFKKDVQARLDTPLRRLIATDAKGKDENAIQPVPALADNRRSTWHMHALDTIGAKTARTVLTLGMQKTHQLLDGKVQFGGLDTELVSSYLTAMCPEVSAQPIATPEYVATFCRSLDEVDARGIPGIDWPHPSKAVTVSQFLQAKTYSAYGNGKEAQERYHKTRPLAEAFAQAFEKARIALLEHNNEVEAE